MTRKRGELGIGLTTRGVYHWSWAGSCFYKWDWINEIQSSAQRAPMVELGVAGPDIHSKDVEENWLARFHSYRRKLARLPVAALEVNPGTAYIALVFYHRHPELRHELAGEEGVTRIQKMDFPELIRELEDRGELRSTSH